MMAMTSKLADKLTGVKAGKLTDITNKLTGMTGKLTGVKSGKLTDISDKKV